MRLRYQLPVASPLPFRAVLASAIGLMRDGAAAIAALDRVVRARFHARDVLFTDSGTSALTLALRAAQAERRAPVALPAWACYDLATAAAGADVRVAVYDLDPLTLSPDPESLRATIAAGVGSVVFAHLYGMPVDIAALGASLGNTNGSASDAPLIINDAAQAAGAMIHGKPVGSVGSLAVLSFGRGKGVTGGAGGALLALDDRGVQALDAVRGGVRRPRWGGDELLALAAQWALGRPELYGVAAALPFLHLGETLYHPPHPARGLTRTAAHALGVTWQFVGSDVSVRRRNARRLLNTLSGKSAFQPVQPATGAETGYLRLPVIHDPALRDQVRSARARRLGIQTGYPEPLVNVTGLQGRCINAKSRFPGARTLAFRSCTFPTHRLLRERDLAAIERWIVQHGSAS